MFVYWVFVGFFIFTSAKNQIIYNETVNDIPECNIAGATIEPFEKIGNKYYVFELSKKLSWYGAQHSCRKLGADLATINSEDELKALSAHLTKLGDSIWWWVGASDLSASRKFQWIGTGEDVTYANWHPGQPDNAYGGEPCVHVWTWKGYPLWTLNDVRCVLELNFICQKSDPRTITYTIW